MDGKTNASAAKTDLPTTLLSYERISFSQTAGVSQSISVSFTNLKKGKIYLMGVSLSRGSWSSWADLQATSADAQFSGWCYSANGTGTPSENAASGTKSIAFIPSAQNITITLTGTSDYTGGSFVGVTLFG